MRTNIVIDDELIERARKLTGLATKRSIVEEALRLLIQQYEQREVRQLRGLLHWEGDLEQMREGRFDPAR
jgi:Arc/MetJ family transcription regulator